MYCLLQHIHLTLLIEVCRCHDTSGRAVPFATASLDENWTTLPPRRERKRERERGSSPMRFPLCRCSAGRKRASREIPRALCVSLCIPRFAFPILAFKGRTRSELELYVRVQTYMDAGEEQETDSFVSYTLSMFG